MQALDILDALEKVFTIIAIVMGGLWAYYNFFRGRVYRPRLEANVIGKLFPDEHNYYLQITSHLKNVGLSKFNINHDTSAIRIYSYKPPSDISEIETAQWDHIGTFPLFKNHQWVESGETVEDKILLSQKKGTCHAFRVVLRVVGHNLSWKAEDFIQTNVS